MGEVCLQHVISDFKDDDTSRNPETIGRDPEKMEQEPAAQGITPRGSINVNNEVKHNIEYANISIG